MEKLRLAAEAFATQGEPLQLSPCGQGHIHDTYRLRCTGGSYALQRVNTAVFPEPALVMENIVRITEQQKRALGGRAERRVLETVPLKAGGLLLWQGGACYRMFRFLENAYAPERSTPAVAEETGLAFGRFLRQMEGLDPRQLHEILPGFHDTPLRLQAFQKAVEEDLAGRAEEARPLIEYILDRREAMGCIVEGLRSGRLPLRVTHNDTKPNNVMLDEKTNQALCVIDLDTVMPGSALYDYGDMLRYGASTAAEDEPDEARVDLDMELASAFTRGYLRGADAVLTPLERRLLPLGALTITLEQAMRFLTDHLNGDAYYKIAYPGHNLVRARAQIALHRAMETKRGRLEALVALQV